MPHSDPPLDPTLDDSAEDRALLLGLRDLAAPLAKGEVSPETDALGRLRLGRAISDGMRSDGMRSDGAGRDRRAQSMPRFARRARIGFGFAAAMAAIFALVMLWPKGDLEYVVEGATLAGDFVQAGAEPADVIFSDGSRIALSTGSAIRVADVTPDGARVRVERGDLTMNVQPHDGANWQVEAGPFSVEVIGTEFDLSWEPRSGQLTIEMKHGVVRVEGPMSPDGVTLRAGQRLEAASEQGEMKMSGRATAGGAPEHTPERAEALGASAGGASSLTGGGESPASDASAKPDDGVDAPGSAAPKAGGASQSWGALVASGDYQRVMEQAESRGIERSLEANSLADLVALSDAARYAGRGDVALRALKAIRTRFAGSAPAATAAFLLGRAAHDANSTAAAISWYERYLSEAPGGTFASEALGRKMVAIHSLHGKASAEPIAEQYLSIYPRGAYAAAAKKIVAP